ncbi:hypothetical protein DS745_22425 [Anaerobacillus alkaliphilus]|uniref:Protein kinase domain-containing protein n=1 Tax=Anaerobacillus alkaliphilus TaxID=1548597 RepID=A0A4V1LFU1_9BACI|nr:protein kinase [Anaerobacillus alkaliphilus]RXI96469.1 hypothetical protein DS745_22425 [Anaerobacillus alkaliphilus]
MSGYTWDKYEIKKLIGSGKKGEVYQAFDPDMKKIVAIKRMPSIKRAKREAFIMKEICSHKYLPKFYHFFIEESHGHIVMEWIDGATLRQRTPTNEQEALTITLKILEALNHIHKIGFIHSDLNRGNVMLIKNNPEMLRLIDFECSQLMADNKDHLQTNSKKKKTTFKITDSSTDERDDLLRVASLCVFLLIGKNRVTYHTLEEIDLKNNELKSVLSRAMDPNKEKRYRTAIELMEALQPFLT